MDRNPERNSQSIATMGDLQTSNTQAAIDLNIHDNEVSQMPASTGDPHPDISTERITSLYATHAGLHSEHPSQNLLVSSDALIYSPVFSSDILHNNQQPNAILRSLDKMYLYTHTQLLLSVSDNSFGGLARNTGPASPDNPLVLSIPELSDVLDIGLRVIYLMEFPSTLPAFSILENAVRFLKQYGIAPLSEWIGPGSHMFTALASLAPEHALELYTLGAEFDTEPLAAHASSFLLELPWSSISEETAKKMGGVYMKRLGNLQIGRMNALKKILLPGPSLHPIQSNECTEDRQTNLSRSYALTATYVCWEANADLPVSHIEETFQQLANKLTCPTCKDGLNRRIEESIEAWTALKKTI